MAGALDWESGAPCSGPSSVATRSLGRSWCPQAGWSQGGSHWSILLAESRLGWRTQARKGLLQESPPVSCVRILTPCLCLGSVRLPECPRLVSPPSPTQSCMFVKPSLLPPSVKPPHVCVLGVCSLHEVPSCPSGRKPEGPCAGLPLFLTCS